MRTHEFFRTSEHVIEIASPAMEIDVHSLRLLAMNEIQPNSTKMKEDLWESAEIMKINGKSRKPL